jgi:ATP-dependent Lhr-like helicase
LLRRAPRQEERGDGGVTVLAASDPANAYGALLKWPAPRVDGTPPQRSGAALVFLDAGQLLGYLSRTGRQLLTFAPDDPADEETWRERLTCALAALARRGTPVLIAEIDGDPAGASPLAASLARRGFVATSRGLLHRGQDRLEGASLHA